MADDYLQVALITEVFFDDPTGERLRRALIDAQSRGADLALLPEIPLNRWSPASKQAIDEDAEEPDGWRQTLMAEAAKSVGIGLVGGAIIRDPDTGTRYNTALLYDGKGVCHARYRKVHLPEEEGYWETSHYMPGTEPPEAISDTFSLTVGLQICSDVNRPQGFQILSSGGTEVVFAPRATPPETYERWQLILRANAIMSGAYVLSTNRPRPEGGAPIGGPSLAIDPFGHVMIETSDPIALVKLERSMVEQASRDYPGYLDRFPDIYAKGWLKLTE
tara:strand:+ start:2328 stop:3155 length:828 start_codon:yes stop_codon:yes gene_type:complete